MAAKNKNTLIVLCASVIAVLLVLKATGYVQQSIQRNIKVYGYNINHKTQGSAEFLATLYPVAVKVKGDKQINRDLRQLNIDAAFKEPPTEAKVVKRPPKPKPIIEQKPEPKPKPKPKPNYLKERVSRLSLYAIANSGAFIEGAFFEIGESIAELTGRPNGFTPVLEKVGDDEVTIKDSKTGKSIALKLDTRGF